MNNLCFDIGFRSLNKHGEPICGDHVDLVRQDEQSTVIVLADGLGSGVKASILSTLTSKIISTMMAEQMSIEDCVATIAATLPVCAVRGIAYSTFTILHLIHNSEAEIIQFDNPHLILLRDGRNLAYPLTSMEIDGKTIYRSKLAIRENDIFILMSDGAVHAGVGRVHNYGWDRDSIIQFMEMMYDSSFTAKTLTTILVDECSKLYGGEPGDDVTVCTVKVRSREPLNLMIGPPSNPNDLQRMMSLFFSKAGKHIICGGTTSMLAAEYLHKPLTATFDYIDPDIPPIASLEGVDLVTEGVLTLNRVLAYALDYLTDNESYAQWGYKKDAASQVARLLFEGATDINFFVGKAVNPAHQNPGLPIHFANKMRLIEELTDALTRMGKKVKVSYY